MDVWFYCRVRCMKPHLDANISADEWVTVYTNGATDKYKVFKPTRFWDNFLYSSIYGITYKAYRIIEFSCQRYDHYQSCTQKLLEKYFWLKEAVAAELLDRKGTMK